MAKPHVCQLFDWLAATTMSIAILSQTLFAVLTWHQPADRRQRHEGDEGDRNAHHGVEIKSGSSALSPHKKGMLFFSSQHRAEVSNTSNEARLDSFFSSSSALASSEAPPPRFVEKQS